MSAQWINRRWTELFVFTEYIHPPPPFTGGMTTSGMSLFTPKRGPVSHGLTLSSLSLPLSSSSTTSRELLSQFSTCSRWRWLEVGDKWKNILLFLKLFYENFRSKTARLHEIKSFFRDARWCFNASWGPKGLTHVVLTLCLLITTIVVLIFFIGL